MQLTPSVGQGEEDLHVETLVTQLAVEAFDVAVLHGLARPNELQMHAVVIVNLKFPSFGRLKIPQSERVEV
jgi:hypothetical protein